MTAEIITTTAIAALTVIIWKYISACQAIYIEKQKLELFEKELDSKITLRKLEIEVKKEIDSKK